MPPIIHSTDSCRDEEGLVYIMALEIVLMPLYENRSVKNGHDTRTPSVPIGVMGMDVRSVY